MTRVTHLTVLTATLMVGAANAAAGQDRRKKSPDCVRESCSPVVWEWYVSKSQFAGGPCEQSA